jgi:hypothetical protein
MARSLSWGPLTRDFEYSPRGLEAFGSDSLNLLNQNFPSR